MRKILIILHFLSGISGQIQFPGQPELQKLFLPEDCFLGKNRVQEEREREKVRVQNADLVGILPQQILIRVRYRQIMIMPDLLLTLVFLVVGYVGLFFLLIMIHFPQAIKVTFLSA